MNGLPRLTIDEELRRPPRSRFTVGAWLGGFAGLVVGILLLGFAAPWWVFVSLIAVSIVAGLACLDADDEESLWPGVTTGAVIGFLFILGNEVLIHMKVGT